jgi:SAM-dependent methyltransferase
MPGAPLQSDEMDPIEATRLSGGVPPFAALERLLATSDFQAIEGFSREFLETNRGALRSYGRRWVPDPLHTWSRLWEYPFTLACLERHFDEQASGTRRILDAGSGATFFPFLCADRISRASISCCDRDGDLADTFQSIRNPRAGQIHFDLGTLQALPYRDDYFDALYCVSVIEHTRYEENILREFKRVVRPGGLVIVTFDVSLAGDCDISVERAVRLLELLDANFGARDTSSISEFKRDIRGPEALTTGYARRTRPEWLPWRRSRRGDLVSLLRFRVPRTQFYDLTVFCGSYVRRAEASE